MSTQLQWSGRGRSLVGICIEVEVDGKVDFEGHKLVVVRESGFLVRDGCMISGLGEVPTGLLKSQL